MSEASNPTRDQSTLGGVNDNNDFEPSSSEEDPIFIARCLLEFKEELKIVPGADRTVLDVARLLSMTFVDDVALHLLFLRAVSFSPKLAARRFILHLQKKLEFFGPAKLVSPVTLSDLSLQDRMALSSGAIRFLPTTDRNDRAVLLTQYTKMKYKDTINMARAFWFFLMTALERERVQRDGIVLVAFEMARSADGDVLNKPQGKLAHQELLNEVASSVCCLPLRIVALHFCHNDAQKGPDDFTRALATSNGIHVQMHIGNREDCILQLGRSGVPEEDLHAWVVGDQNRNEDGAPTNDRKRSPDQLEHPAQKAMKEGTRAPETDQKADSATLPLRPPPSLPHLEAALSTAIRPASSIPMPIPCAAVAAEVGASVAPNGHILQQLQSQLLTNAAQPSSALDVKNLQQTMMLQGMVGNQGNSATVPTQPHATTTPTSQPDSNGSGLNNNILVLLAQLQQANAINANALTSHPQGALLLPLLAWNLLSQGGITAPTGLSPDLSSQLPARLASHTATQQSVATLDDQAQMSKPAIDPPLGVAAPPDTSNQQLIQRTFLKREGPELAHPPDGQGESIDSSTKTEPNRTTVSQRRPVLLYRERDEVTLSAYQCLVRQQIEMFEATDDDVQFNISKMSKMIVVGQVGIRCRYCSALPQYSRPKAAVYYPRSLDSLYQFGQNMVKNHLCGTCSLIPQEIKAKLVGLQEERRRGKGGRERWAEAAREMGVYEKGDGLRFG